MAESGFCHLAFEIKVKVHSIVTQFANQTALMFYILGDPSTSLRTCLVSWRLKFMNDSGKEGGCRKL